MRIYPVSFHGNPSIGLHGFCHSKLCLLGERPSAHDQKEIAKVLKAELHHFTIAGTGMPGVFLVGNSHALLVPSIAFPQELGVLERLGLTATVFATRLTCLGNNIIANDHGCLVNPDFSDAEITRLKQLLKVPVKRIKIAGLETPGACIVLNGKRGIIHRDAASDEIEMAIHTLGLESLEPASVNLGSPYIRAGIINNTHGLLVGSQSGGPEIVHIDQALGYL